MTDRLFAGATGLMLLLLTCSGATGCKSPYYADRGAGVGALAGAITGAAIGEHNGNTAAGAVIGTAVGALTGAAIGESMDAEVARSQAIIEQRMGRRMAGAVTVADVVAMSQNGVSEDVISTHIRANGVGQRPTADDVIFMTKQGVGSTAINAMLQTPQPQLETRPVPSPQPVIVEHHYGPPYWYHPHRYHYRPRRGGVSWGVSFSN